MNKNRRRSSSHLELADTWKIPAWQVGGPRNIRKRKLDEPKVCAALKRWLFREKINYAQAQARLLQRFGLKVGTATICKFWQRWSGADQAAQVEPGTVSINLTIHSSTPVRVQVSEVKGGRA
ncbi:MAG: hypothetical protein EPO07_02300 [Verrucomicrobia bacterium]|nr:MAG: hypothetical protein EPO07_02300 [Verrucomicrobiota bacterium]